MLTNIFKAISLFFLSCLLVVNGVDASDYFFKRISIEQGLSHPGVTSIVRDHNGTLWIGTKLGLNRVNRNDLKAYFHNNTDNKTIPGNYIYNLHEDMQHNLWVVTDGGLSLYNRDKDNFEIKINNRIQAIANTEEGVLFGGYTAIYYYNYKTKGIKRLPLRNNDPNKGISYKDYFITHLIPVNKDTIIVGTECDGIYTYNTVSSDFTPLITKDTDPLKTILFDKDSKEIYFSVFQKGLYCYNLDGKYKKHYTTNNSGLLNNIILDIKKQKDKIWIATDGSGVSILDVKKGQFDNIQHIPGDVNSLPVNSISILYNDSDNNIWAGSVRDGVFLFRQAYIRTYKDVTVGSNKGLSDKVVISLFEDKRKNLWIGTDGGGINMFDPLTEQFTHHLKTYGDKVVSITDLSDGELLVSLYAKGLFVYNIKNQSYKPFIIVDQETNADECFSGFVPICHRITSDRLLILAKNAYVYDLRSGQFKELKYAQGLTNLHSLQLTYNDGTRSFMTKGNTIYTFENEGNIINQLLSLGNNEYVNSICYEKSKNRLWIASTAGLKFYDINTNKLEKVDTNMFKRISYMSMDTENHLWINASNMMFSYDIKNNKFMIWDDSDGFLPNDILTLYIKPSESDYIYMGGSNGLVKIDKRIDYNNDVPILFSLQDIELDGKIYLGNSLSSSRKIKVPQSYSSLKIRVNLKEKDFFRHILFRYRMDNQGHSSIIESYNNMLDLASLAPGEYDVYVSCMTKNGSWTKETSLITFEIIPPWYKRTWFIIISIGFILGGVTLFLFILMNKNKRELEWEMAMHRQELNEDKIQFLTNVSHELRTPLTLIYSPLKRILENEEIDSEKSGLRKQMENIYRQASQMKGIINWVLDYDRNTNISDDLKLSFIDLNDLIRQIAYDFDQEFVQKCINLKLDLNDKLKPIQADGTKIRVIISNLLMNALKFSNADSEVIIKSSLDGDLVRVEIKDNGIGLKDVDTEKLFTRFYQGQHNRKGSGIGLAYCKELIEKHGGSIGVVDNEEIGTTVYFDIPYRTISEDKILDRFDESDSYNNLFDQHNDIDRLDMSIYKVLIVDDNKEFLLYLESELKSLFKNVLKAKNGAEALIIMKASQPDILISDVMMPVMNGYQLCRSVKEQIEISHIPVILLTAKSDQESQKIGYKLGADSYLSKPFDIDLLLSIVKNTLKNKEAIKLKYQQKILSITPEQSTISNADEQFMIKLNQLIKDNYSDSDFDVRAIIKNLAMSRASLYNKMKNITGLGINDYINKYRIAAACSLLTETDKSIADIAFETGFTSQRYFSTVFKQATEKTPSNYRSDSKELL